MEKMVLWANLLPTPRNITLLTKAHIAKAMIFPVVMYRCESWPIKKAEHQIIDAFKLCWRRLFFFFFLEKTLKSPLDSNEIKPVNPKGNQPWIFIGRTDAEAKVPILEPPDAKRWLIGKDPYAGKDWGQVETKDDMVVWYRWLNGHDFEQPLGYSEGQGNLACKTMGLQRVRHDSVTE